MRVESVTVVAVQRPEDGGLLLRVLPNVVARRESPGSAASVQAATGGHDGEDWEVPPEPACDALVSRLKGQPLAAGSLPAGCSVCVICAEEMTEAGAPVVELPCGHGFHENCLRRWLARRHTCPTCRLELEVDDVKYLRSIGLEEEADILEKVQQEKQAQEQQKQAAARRRWVDSMRRGQPVHFGLTCGRCAQTPLVGDCYRCVLCEGFILCGDCFTEREARLAGGGSAGSSCSPPGAVGGEDLGSCPGAGVGGAAGPAQGGTAEAEHPSEHVFIPFGSLAGSGLAGDVPPGPGGLLTVLVPTAARGTLGEEEEPGASSAGAGGTPGEAPGGEAPGEAALAAAEVAFAAVRSLALAPLAATPPPAPLHGTGGGGSIRSASPGRGPFPRGRGR